MTINEAAQVTGWSERMLRYIEHTGLVTPRRSESDYRVYGDSEVMRLRELKELIARFDIGLSDVAFAARVASSPELRDSLECWLARGPEATATPASQLGFSFSMTGTSGC